jgi:Methionyl-tRNA formyltransferase
MRVGFVSNSDVIIPLAYTLAAQKLQVYAFIDKGVNTEKAQMLQAFAKQLNISMHFENDSGKDLYQWISQEKLDAVFIMGFSKLINLSKIDKSTQQHLFNIHFGPLPAYKGPSPVFWQLKHGTETLGISIHKLTDKFDEGAVVWRKSYPNQAYLCHESATKYLSGMSVEGVFFLLNILAAKHPILELAPLDVAPSYCKRPEAVDVLIDWQKMDAAEIVNLIKACNPWNKGAITLFKGQELKLMDAHIISSTTAGGKPGEIADVLNDLRIYTCDGKIIATNMLYHNDCFIPAYQAKYRGLVKGTILG